MSLYRHAKSKFYWCCFTVARQRFRKSTRTGDLRKAEIEERRLRSIEESKAPHRRASNEIDMATMAAWDMERAIAAGVDLSRSRTLEWIWTPLTKFFNDKHAGKITERDLESYIASRRGKGVRGQTIRREMQALKRGLEIAKRKGFIHEIPIIPKIKSNPPKAEQRGKLHPPEIISSWLSKLPEDARDEATFAALTGLRAMELKRVRFDWVVPVKNDSGISALLKMPAEATKSRKERTVGLSHQAFEIIKNRSLKNTTNPVVFSSENHRGAYRFACKKIGYSKRITLRDLRHTWATLALAGTGDPWAVQASLGHSDLRTTSLYQSTTDERAALAASAAEKGLALATPNSHTMKQGEKRHDRHIKRI